MVIIMLAFNLKREKKCKSLAEKQAPQWGVTFCEKSFTMIQIRGKNLLC